MVYDRRNFRNKRRVEQRRKLARVSALDNRKLPSRRSMCDRRASGERRTSLRFPVLSDFVKPVEFYTDKSKQGESLPGIITHLSASGLALLSFVPIKTGTELALKIKLPCIEEAHLEGVVVRVEQKGDSCYCGIKFVNMPHEIKTTMNKIANDFNDCELKLSFGIKDVCTKRCLYFDICEKPQKIKG